MGLCLIFSLISKALMKLTINQTELVIVASVWQAQPGWLVLLRPLISRPVLVPNSPTLLSHPTNLNQVNPRLHLAMVYISTNIFKLSAFQQTLLIYSLQQHKTFKSRWNHWCCLCSGWQTDPLSSFMSGV